MPYHMQRTAGRTRSRLPSRVEGEIASYRRRSGWLISHQGNQQRGKALHCPSDKHSQQLGPGASVWEGQSRTQGAGEAGTQDLQTQENSQLEWSDYSLHSIPCRTLTILAGLSFAISLVSLQPGNTNTTLLYFQGCIVCPSAILYFSSCGSVFGILKFPVIMKRSFYPIAISKRQPLLIEKH